LSFTTLFLSAGGRISRQLLVLAERVRMDEIRALPRAKRGESTNVEQSKRASSKRARKNVRLRCQTIQADRLLTLTYRENMQDIERCKR